MQQVLGLFKSTMRVCYFFFASFGYCEKVDLKGHKPIGHYGNGFKSGSMRLGKDAIIFTKSKTTMSVGFLSQTFLEAINAETVLVPIVTWHKDSCILDTDHSVC